MGNKLNKKQSKYLIFTRHKKQEQPQEKQYKPRYIIPPTIQFVTYSGHPINIKPKHSFVCNGVKCGWYV